MARRKPRRSRVGRPDLDCRQHLVRCDRCGLVQPNAHGPCRCGSETATYAVDILTTTRPAGGTKGTP